MSSSTSPAPEETGSDGRSAAGTATTADGVTISTRPVGDIPTTYPPGYTHDQLKAKVDTAEPSDARGLSDHWVELGTQMQGFADSMRHIANSSEARWIGMAGNAARGALLSLGDWSETTGSAIQTMSGNVGAQSTAAERVQTNMPEPVPYDAAEYLARIASTSNPFEWAQTIADAYQQYNAHQAAEREAQHVVSVYSQSLHETASTMPAFAPPPTFGGETDTDDPPIGGRPGVPIGTGTGVTTPGSLPGLDSSGPVSPGGVPPAPPSSPAPWSPLGPTPAPTMPQQPGPVPPGPGPLGPMPPRPAPALPGDPGPYPPGPTIPGGPGRPGPGGAGTGRPGSAGSGSGVPGRVGPGGPGTGRAAFGPGGSGFGSGGSGSGAPGTGTRGIGGLGAAAGMADDAAAVRSGAAGRGGAGSGAFGPMAGAGTGRDEDKEHQRPSYLVESEDVWGDGTLVAPPVIGEAPPEHYRRG